MVQSSANPTIEWLSATVWKPLPALIYEIPLTRHQHRDSREA